MTIVPLPLRRSLLLATCVAVVAGTPLSPLGMARAAGPKGTVLRVATLLPRGSSWMREFERFAKRVKRATAGRVRIQTYPGGIMGDERDMLRKMRQGRLDGAALSGTGLGQVLPACRVLEMPLLFRDVGEVEAVRDAIAPQLLRRLRSRGYTLLTWGELGWVHYYARHQVSGVAGLRRMTFWAWTDDPLALAIVKQFRLRVLKLSIRDVLPSLQAGLLAGVYGTPYTTLALQWHTQLRYYSRARIAYGIAGLVLRRKALARLSAEDQRTLRAEGRRYGRRHVAQVRRENREATTLLRRSGLRPLSTASQISRELRRLAPRVWTSLTGKLFSAKLLQKVISLRDAHRQRSAKRSKGGR